MQAHRHLGVGDPITLSSESDLGLPRLCSCDISLNLLHGRTALQVFLRGQAGAGSDDVVDDPVQRKATAEGGTVMRGIRERLQCC